MTSESRPPPSRHTFQKTSRLLDDVFKVDEYCGSFEKYDGSMSPEQRLLVFERGETVAALLYDTAHREVILVEQFRLPTVPTGLGGGWLLEPAAGMVRTDETPRACIIRELQEETGFEVTELAPIARFFVSPGGTSERIHLFYAEVARRQQKAQGGGVKIDGENIRIVRMPISEFFAKLRAGEFEDAKLIIAGQWLRSKLVRAQVDDRTPLEAKERRVKLPEEKPSRLWGANAVGAKPAKMIGYMVGDIMRVHEVDVWVNPLDTDMLLDRFNDRTVAARIRREGAKKYPDGGRIMSDTIGNELRDKMNGNSFVNPAKVIDTKPGELAVSNKVKRIFHVAAIGGVMGQNISSDVETLEICVDNVLIEVERKSKYTSILFPLLGTGEGGYPVQTVAPRLLRRAIHFYQAFPKAKLERIYFLPYTIVDGEYFADAMATVESMLEPPGA